MHISELIKSSTFGFMKYVFSFLVVLVTLISFTACNKNKVSKVPLPEGYYENQWNEPLAAANDYDRKVFVQFYAEWCSLCASFKEDVLNDDEVELYMKDKFVPVLLDEEKGVGKELFEKHSLGGHPLSVMFDKDGAILGQHKGKMTKEQFLNWIKPFE